MKTGSEIQWCSWISDLKQWITYILKQWKTDQTHGSETRTADIGWVERIEIPDCNRIAELRAVSRHTVVLVDGWLCSHVLPFGSPARICTSLTNSRHLNPITVSGEQNTTCWTRRQATTIEITRRARRGDAHMGMSRWGQRRPGGREAKICLGAHYKRKETIGIQGVRGKYSWKGIFGEVINRGLSLR
jgi:hypothetical protein